MTLNDILVSALAQLNRGHDAQTLDIWRDKLTRFANEACVDLAAVYKPRCTESISVSNKTFDTASLLHSCVKVCSLKKDGAEIPFSEGGASGILAADTDGGAEITYIYMPAVLSSPTDEPELPAWCHGLIVSYVVARERASGDVNNQSGSNIYFSMYEVGKAMLFPHMGSGESYKIVNRW